MRQFIILVFIAVPLSLNSQSSCTYYKKYIEKGDAEINKQHNPNFEAAINAYNIALLHCPSKAEEARAKILEAFKAIEILKISAEKARSAAEKASGEAQKAKQDAVHSAEIAVLERQSAEAQRNLVQKSQYKTLALNLALQAELEDNPQEKISLALQAYNLNKGYNGNAWNPTIINALWLSHPAQYGQYLTTGQSGILDFINTGTAIIAITDSGELISIKGGDHKILPSEEQYFYRRNSLSFDHLNRILEFQDQLGEVIRFKQNESGWEKLNHGSAQAMNQVPLNRDTLMMTLDGARRLQNNQLLISLKKNQSAVTHSISASTTYLAVGTQDGWLYIRNLKTGNNKFEGPYHQSGSRISDIAFDINEKFIATSGLDGSIKINMIDSLDTKRPAEIISNTWVNCIEFLPENRLMIGTQDGTIIQYHYSQDALAELACEQLTGKLYLAGLDKGRADSTMISECPKIVIYEKESP